MVEISLRSFGNEFHMAGAFTEKALVPNLDLLGLTERRFFDPDLKFLGG